MENKMYKVLIFSALFLIILASCTLPTDRDSGSSNPPVEPPQEEPTIQVKVPPTPVSPLAPASPPAPNTTVEIEPPAPVSPQEPSVTVTEEPPAEGGGEPSGEAGAQNPLPPAVNLEKSSIELEKLGKDTAGGGGGPGCNNFAGQTEQEITFLYDIFSAHTWEICFIGYPQAVAEVRLSTQSGFSDTRLSVEPQSGAHGFTINLPASITRDGPLQVEFTVKGVTYTKSFDIQNLDQVSIYQDRVNILDEEGKWGLEFNFGEQFELLGVNLLPNTPVYVGIYGISDFDGELYYYVVDQFEITTNAFGEFLGTIQITEKYRQSRENYLQGLYIIYYGYGPNLFTNKRENNERYDRFTVGSISTTWQPCSADYPSRLRVGDVGIVNNNPPLPKNVRNNPSLFGEIIGEFQPGEQFIILDGPVCEGGWVWWYVQNATNSNNFNNEALTGWTSEGDLTNYWLIPYNPEEPKG